MIIARGPAPLAPDIKAKISLFCDVPPEAVISVPDQPLIYEVPLVLEAQGVGQHLTELLQLGGHEPDFTAWKEFLSTYRQARGSVEIAVVGKYTELRDAYLSHIEAFHHVQGRMGTTIHLQWYDSEELPRNPAALARLERSDAVLVPGGFGARGVEGKLRAIELARTASIPYLGVCYGFQMAAIEFARNVLKLPQANTTEVDPHSPDPIVGLLEDQKEVAKLGGTMRLGAQRVVLESDSVLAKLYGRVEIFERHRHRFEITPAYLQRFEQNGLKVSAWSPDGRVEALEIPSHPFFIGVQYHPEFLSRPEAPHPLYLALVRAALARKEVPASVAPSPALA
jgi:CTP synthase